MLPKPSEEQQQIISAIIEGYNVVVDSIAGSGKTTCSLHIAKSSPEKKILHLTYNAKLRLETKEKVKKYGIHNLEVHSYHSFCVKYFNEVCYTDNEIDKLLKNDTQCKRKFFYDRIILDEVQDMTPLYFKLWCKIVKHNNNPNANICIFGDKNQSIFEFNKADERFIIYGDEIFTFNNCLWKKCKMSISFRVTFEMSEFINNVMLKEERIHSLKVSTFKPRYLICNCFDEYNGFNAVFDELKYYLDSGYLPSEIFILAPSISSNNNSPIRKLENKIKRNLDISIFIPMGDDEKMDTEIIDGKLVFTTYHQSKGLERKVIILYGFDNSYFKYYKKNRNSFKCPNELFVATTRAIERISLIHHFQNDYLDFLCKDKINEFCEVIEYREIVKKEEDNSISSIGVIGVCDLLHHLPMEVLQACYEYLDVEQIKPCGEKIDIVTKFEKENVSEITGIAIPAYLEYVLTGKIDIYETLLENKLLHVDISENMTCQDILKIANSWNSYKTEFLFKLYQIKNYNWLSEEQLLMCMERLKQFQFDSTTRFECGYKYQHKMLMNKYIQGYIDCIHKEYKNELENIYEFKCVKQLKIENYIQAALYKYLYEICNKKTVNKCLLYNILTDELVSITCSFAYLEKMLDFLLFHKYNQVGYITDENFLLNIKSIRREYFKNE
jgi:hypothetical protein